MPDEFQCGVCGEQFEGDINEANQEFRLHCKREHSETLQRYPPDWTADARYEALKRPADTPTFTDEEIEELGESPPSGLGDYE